MNHHNKISLFFMTIIALASIPLHVPADSNADASSFQPVIRQTPDRWDWTNAKWTFDDKQFQSLRRNIDTAIASDALNSEQIDTYRQLAALHAYVEPVSMFRWGYASYEAQHLIPPKPQVSAATAQIFFKVPSVPSYEFMRMRFLVEASSQDSHLVPLGQRLLVKNPNDYQVVYGLIQCYHPGLSNAEKENALSLANRLLRLDPSKPRAQTVLAAVYFRAWMIKRNKADGQAAIDNYKKYLLMTADEDPWRQNALNDIQYVQQRNEK